MFTCAKGKNLASFKGKQLDFSELIIIVGRIKRFIFRGGFGIVLKISDFIKNLGYSLFLGSRFALPK